MAHPVLSLLTLVGASCQLSLAWRRSRPDYSAAIEGLGAVAVHIDRLIRASRTASPDRIEQLRRAKQKVDQAYDLLLDDLRQGQAGSSD